jgi:hypothetical protein
MAFDMFVGYELGVAGSIISEQGHWIVGVSPANLTSAADA